MINSMNYKKKEMCDHFDYYHRSTKSTSNNDVLYCKCRVECKREALKEGKQQSVM